MEINPWTFLVLRLFWVPHLPCELVLLYSQQVTWHNNVDNLKWSQLKFKNMIFICSMGWGLQWRLLNFACFLRMQHAMIQSERIMLLEFFVSRIINGCQGGEIYVGTFTIIPNKHALTDRDNTRISFVLHIGGNFLWQHILPLPQVLFPFVFVQVRKEAG